MGLHFDFSSEQQMLASSARRLFEDARRTAAYDAGGAAAELRAMLAEHGVLGLMAPARSGGLALGLTEALAVSVECGRVQLPFPLIETFVAGDLIGRIRPELAGRIVRGTDMVTCATAGDAEILPQAGGRLRLNGRISAPFARPARWLALPVRWTDRNEPGPWATLIDLHAPGVSLEEAPQFDLTCTVCHVDLDLEIDAADVVVHELPLMLAVLAAGELTGAARQCFDATIRYLKERVQFGKPIGTNQALRHVAADDWIRLQGMQAASEYAAAAFDASGSNADGGPLPRGHFRRAAHIAKAHCSAAARTIAEHAMQLHGGIGFTWEFGLHLPLRRILRLASSHGTPALHYDSLAEELLQHDRSADQT